ncbi:sialate O-acetylesterase [Klebsiella aerogenes]|uniref:sialate O-acetylesterase n=1 Tax=Klebsiella aerogenes TaxID=548 RepID=UPI00243395DB|nr:sialate O-acetylesterase [Klebsiella aerogenes]WFV98046.1 sialate O-acetylesterase [Klebsiella aerogenes]
MAFTPPLGSTSPEVFLDNTTRLDKLVNGPAADVPDRAGDPLYSWRGIHQNLIPLSKQYMTLADAQADIANIPEGSTTYYRSPDDSALAIEVMNNGGALEPTGRKMPTQEFVDSLNTRLSDLASNFFQSLVGDEVMLDMVDEDWFSFFRVMASGAFGAINCMLSPDGVYVRDLVITHQDGSSGLNYQDPDGFFVSVIDSDGKVAPGSLSGDGKFITKAGGIGWLNIEDDEGFFKVLVDENGELITVTEPPVDTLDLAAADAQNKAYSQNVRSRYNAAVQRLVTGLIHLLIYSQSLGTQQEGWPALSKEAIEGFDNLMLGESIRPASRTNPAFVPLGNVELKPLRAVVQSGTGDALVSDEQVASLPAGAPNEGEGGVAMANALRRLWLQRNCLERDPTRRFVLSSTGVNGRSIEQLSKGASPELYQRPLQAVQQVKVLADQSGVSYSIGAILWMQGEWNYLQTNGSNDKDTYKRNLGKLYDDMIADMAEGIAGQKAPPALFMYQTGASFTRDNANLSIGMAQWEFCRENDNAYMVGPVYHYPDKGGHLGPNGYRWFDMKVAQVMHLVLNEGQGWEPLGPVKIKIIGREIFVFYHVPSPPLTFRPSYIKNVATTYADKGFRVTDSAGAAAISSVDIVADTIIKITIARDLTTGAKLWYGDDSVHHGNGNVFDSDTFNALDDFIYEAGTGQYESENIPELVGKPYPSNNASVQFCLSIPYGE